ncbi:MAG: hypothetical protein IKZ84_01750, partial [Victivallales bacterium]|nr:hypothetical protein [Victivallales bacterium]
ITDDSENDSAQKRLRIRKNSEKNSENSEEITIDSANKSAQKRLRIRKKIGKKSEEIRKNLRLIRQTIQPQPP